jgi:hypothetical protein
MAGDGVSLPQSIALSGSVAKAQAKGQQSAQPATPFADQLDKKDDLKVQTVKETQKTDQRGINPDEERAKDKRKRRRLKRNQRELNLSDEGQEASEDFDATTDDEEQTTGTLLDLRV